MKTYRATFVGRKAGAIGVFDRWCMTVQGVDETHARYRLYEHHGFEHIQFLSLTEIGPTDPQPLAEAPDDAKG